jgi:group I intron endonuclease
MVGVYKITSPTGKIYIGQSWTLEKRLKDYTNNPKCKCQRKLYNSLICYGPAAHKFEIIYVLPDDITQDVLDAYETFPWSQYKEAGFDMLNIREPGSRGKKSKEEIMQSRFPETPHTIKAREWLISKDQVVYEHIGLCYKEFGEFYPEFANLLGQDRFLSCYKKLIRDELPHPIFNKKKVKMTVLKKVCQYSLECELIKVWSSAKEANETLTLKCVGDACQNPKILSYGGFRWAYEGEELKNSIRNRNMPLYQYTLNGTLAKVWYSLKEAQQFFKSRHIEACLAGKKETACGYLWSRQKLQNHN